MYLPILSSESFKEAQLKYKRVKEAYQDKGQEIDQLLYKKGLHDEKLSLYIRAFKKEGEMEMWGKNKGTEKYQLIKTYRVCHASGDLGPKRKEGDKQVPEGFYKVNRFNPNSKFHLSLGIDYPNPSDKILSDSNKPGGDIFIHGGCVSIGCLAMTDDAIKEIYILAVEAKNAGSEMLPVHIFPFKMDDQQMELFVRENLANKKLEKLWSDLKFVFDYFEQSRTIPSISFLENGHHKFYITN